MRIKEIVEANKQLYKLRKIFEQGGNARVDAKPYYLFTKSDKDILIELIDTRLEMHHDMMREKGVKDVEKYEAKY